MSVELAVFDIDGTLFKRTIEGSDGDIARSVWSLIAKRLGDSAMEQQKAMYEKWQRDEYAGYGEWVDATAGMHRDRGLTQEQFEQAVADTEYRDGVIETFEQLEARGVRTAAVSGGFKAQAERVQHELGIDHAAAACEYVWDEDGELAYWNLLPVDYTGKLRYVELLADCYGLSLEECAFVGDGTNDTIVAQAVGTSVACDAVPEMEAACDHALDARNEDFTAVLPLLSLDESP